MDLPELVRRLQIVEDIEAIKKLKALYCYLCDQNYNAERITECFVEDGIWDGGSFGVFKGRAEIHEFFAHKAPKILLFAMHMVINPVIEVDGDQATGRWYIFEPVTFAEGKQAGWLAGYYHDDYVKSDGQWKYKHLRFLPYFSTHFGEPWARTSFGPQ